MKLPRLSTHQNKKRLALAVIVLAVSVSSGATYYYSIINSAQKGQSPVSPPAYNEGINYSKPTEDEKIAGNAQKENTLNASTDGGSNKSPSKSVDVYFTSISQNNGTVQVRSIISQIINGECALTVNRGTFSKTYKTGVQINANTSTCKGFDIPVSDFEAGTWSIRLLVSSSDSRYGEATTTMEVK